MIILKNISPSDETVQYEENEFETFVANGEYDLETTKSVKTQRGLAYLTSLVLQSKLTVTSEGFLRNVSDATKILRVIFERIEGDFFLIKDKVERFVTESEIIIYEDDFNKEVVINSTSDYSILLPSLQDVSTGSVYVFKNMFNNDVEGTIVPANSDHIYGEDEFKLYGRGKVTIKKRLYADNNQPYWSIISASNLKSSLLEGKSKRVSFESSGSITVDHNLGYIPSVQIWTSDDQGSFVLSDLDVDHDYESKNSFVVNIEGSLTGYVLYI